MLKKLKTKDKWNDIHLSEKILGSDDWLLSSLAEVESNAKELICYIGELMNKNGNLKRCKSEK